MSDIFDVISGIREESNKCDYNSAINKLAKLSKVIIIGMGEVMEDMDNMKEEIAELRKSNDNLANLIAQEYES